MSESKRREVHYGPLVNFTSLAVTTDMHEAVKLFAFTHDYTVLAATKILLKYALEHIYMPKKGNNEHSGV
jgi:hypothetical protein